LRADYGFDIHGVNHDPRVPRFFPSSLPVDGVDIVQLDDAEKLMQADFRVRDGMIKPGSQTNPKIGSCDRPLAPLLRQDPQRRVGRPLTTLTYKVLNVRLG
jgi:hypothetical protein